MTRQQCAQTVLERVRCGPSFTLTFASVDYKSLQGLSNQQRMDLKDLFEKSYRLWAESWIVGDLERLLSRDLSPTRRSRRAAREQMAMTVARPR